jgi:hypothetical protein
MAKNRQLAGDDNCEKLCTSGGLSCLNAYLVGIQTRLLSQSSVRSCVFGLLQSFLYVVLSSTGMRRRAVVGGVVAIIYHRALETFLKSPRSGWMQI